MLDVSIYFPEKAVNDHDHDHDHDDDDDDDDDVDVDVDVAVDDVDVDVDDDDDDDDADADSDADADADDVAGGVRGVRGVRGVHGDVDVDVNHKNAVELGDNTVPVVDKRCKWTIFGAKKCQTCSGARCFARSRWVCSTISNRWLRCFRCTACGAWSLRLLQCPAGDPRVFQHSLNGLLLLGRAFCSIQGGTLNHLLEGFLYITCILVYIFSCFFQFIIYVNLYNQRKFRSQTSDNMER